MTFTRHAVLLIAAIGLTSPATNAANAADVGWRPFEVAASAADPDPIAAALFYPTEAASRDMAMGPYMVHVAPMAPPQPTMKGLIIVSHGTGGSELSLHDLAEALAKHGYLAAALRHPGDNYLDRSVWQKPPGTMFGTRPHQASRLVDALLSDPDWRGRIAADARGPLVGAVGHSAGGFTVIALAGGQIDLSLIVAHCRTDQASDPIFCGMDGTGPVPAAPLLPPATDSRVRAVVAMAPVGVMFTEASLRAMHVPAMIYGAENDRWLPPRFHAARIAQYVPGASLQIVPNAWHFAFMGKLGTPVQTLDGDANADPAGFDRAALLTQLGNDVPAFFDRALAAP